MLPYKRMQDPNDLSIEKAFRHESDFSCGVGVSYLNRIGKICSTACAFYSLNRWFSGLSKCQLLQWLKKDKSKWITEYNHKGMASWSYIGNEMSTAGPNEVIACVLLWQQGKKGTGLLIHAGEHAEYEDMCCKMDLWQLHVIIRKHWLLAVRSRCLSILHIFAAFFKMSLLVNFKK